MDEYKPITGELRAKLAEYKPTEGKCNLITRAVGSTGYARLIELCDTIDAIHARLEAAYDRLRAERDSMAAALDAAQGEHAYAPESHYMMLPKDADGVPIHVGDTLDGYGKTIKVAELRYGRSGWVLVSRDGNGYADTLAFAHHHEPTVEDVLREVVTLCHNTWKKESAFHFYDVDDVMESGNIAEYAAKLRLAGEK